MENDTRNKAAGQTPKMHFNGPATEPITGGNPNTIRCAPAASPVEGREEQSVLVTERPAIESAIRFIEETVAPRRCDNEAVAGCVRCKTVYLARTLKRLLAAAPSHY